MRYRRFGRATSRSPRSASASGPSPATGGAASTTSTGCSRAALDAGINFIDTAPVYGDGGRGRDDPRDVPRPPATRSCSRRSAATTSTAERKFPGQSERPHDWQPESIRAAVRGVAAPARHRPHRPLPAAQHAHRADPRRRAVGGARAVPERGQGARARRRARSRRSAGSTKATARSTTARSCRCRRCSTCSSRSRVARSRRGHRVATASVGLISRVPHASDTLSGKVTRDTVFPRRRPPRAPQPRQHARQLRQGRDARVPLGGRPVARSARPRSPASSPNPAFTTVLPTVLSVDDVREYAAASDLPLTADETTHVDELLVAQLRPRTATRCR